MSRCLIVRKFTFEAAHHLLEYEGKCATVHGHSYKLFVAISVDYSSIQPSGVVVDFGDLKVLVNEKVIKRLDHQDLNEDELFMAGTSAEVMSMAIYKLLNTAVAGLADGTRLEWVRLWETENCYVQFPSRGRE